MHKTFTSKEPYKLSLQLLLFSPQSVILNFYIFQAISISFLGLFSFMSNAFYKPCLVLLKFSPSLLSVVQLFRCCSTTEFNIRFHAALYWIPYSVRMFCFWNGLGLQLFISSKPAVTHGNLFQASFGLPELYWKNAWEKHCYKLPSTLFFPSRLPWFHPSNGTRLFHSKATF